VIFLVFIISSAGGHHDYSLRAPEKKNLVVSLSTYVYCRLLCYCIIKVKTFYKFSFSLDCLVIVQIFIPSTPVSRKKKKAYFDG
jgi:hypothetical protein